MEVVVSVQLPLLTAPDDSSKLETTKLIWVATVVIT